MNRYRWTAAVTAAFVLAAALLTACTSRPADPENSSPSTLTTRMTTQIPDPASAAVASSAQSVSAATSAVAAKSRAQQSSVAKAASAAASQRSVAQEAAERAAEQSAAEAAASVSAASESAAAQAAAEQSAADQSAAERSAVAESLAQQAASEQADAEKQAGEQAGSDPAVARALAEGWYTPNGNYVSPETAARAIAAGIAPGETVPNYLRCGTICGEGPTSGEVQMANLCLRGIIPASECMGIDAQAIIDANGG